MNRKTSFALGIAIQAFSLNCMAANSIATPLHIPIEDIFDRSNSELYSSQLKELAKYLQSVEKTMVKTEAENIAENQGYKIVNTGFEDIKYSDDGSTIEFVSSTTVGSDRKLGKYKNFARILKCKGKIKVRDLPLKYDDFSKLIDCKTIQTENLIWNDEMSVQDRMGILSGKDKDGQTVFQRYYPIGAARRGDKTGVFCYADGALDDGKGGVWRVGLDAYQYDGFSRNIHIPDADPNNPEASYQELFNSCETGQDVYDSDKTHVTSIGSHGPVTKTLRRGAVSAGCRRKRNIDRAEHETIIWPLLQRPKEGGTPLVRLQVKKEAFGADVFNHPYDFCGPKPKLHIPKAIPVEEAEYH